MQPGSSIMPGKVNPVIPEIMNQICFRVIGNDVTVTFAAEAGQLQLNVMEPVIAYSIMESIRFMRRGMDTLRMKCIDGITANREVCENLVKNSTRIAKMAQLTGRGVYELVLAEGLLSKEQLDDMLKLENMIGPRK